MTIFYIFFHDGGRLPSVMHMFEPPTKGIWRSLLLQNLVGIETVVSIVCKFLYFAN